MINHRRGFVPFRMGDKLFTADSPPEAVPTSDNAAKIIARAVLPPAPEPTLLDLVKNFTTATARWLKAGRPVVAEETYRERTTICAGCQFYDPDGWAGLGKCNHRQCGCTKWKRLLATESCPAGKWPAAAGPSAKPSGKAPDTGKQGGSAE